MDTVEFLARREAGESQFSGIELTGGELRCLDVAQLTHANLRRANLRGANLKGANLSQADARHAAFAGADLIDVIFERTLLEGTGLAVTNTGMLA